MTIIPWFSLGAIAQVPLQPERTQRVEVSGSPYTNAMLPSEDCFNGVDDDGDGQIDCADGDCQVLINGGFEDVPMQTAPNSFVTFPQYPTFMGSWAAVNIDGEVFYESTARPAFEGNKYASLLQNAAANPRQPWNETSWGSGGYDRFLFIANTFPSTEYSMAFQHAADSRYSYLGDRTLVQIQSMDTEYYFDTLITTPGYFDWTQVDLPFTTDASTNSVAILFSAYSPDNASVLVDGLRLCGARVPVIDAVDDEVVLLVNTPKVIEVLANDANLPEEGLAMNIYASGEPDHGTVVLNQNGTVTYTPDPGFVGTDAFEYEICNTQSFSTQCDAATVHIEVTEPVTISTDTFYLAIPEDESLQVCGSYFETGTAVSSSVCDGGQIGSVTILSPSCAEYAPFADQNGTDQVCIVQCDGSDCDTSIFIITISPVNDAPVAVDDSYNTRIGQSVQMAILSNDHDADNTLRLSGVLLLEEPLNGSIYMGPEDRMTFTPDPGFTGVDSLVYLVCDGEEPALCDVASVRIYVDDVPDTVYVSIPEDGSTMLCLDSLVDGLNDPGLTLFSLTSTGQTSAEQSACAGYAPPADYNGMDTLWFVYCSGSCDTSVYVISVEPVNDPPVAQDDAAATDRELEVSIDVAANDSDPRDNGPVDMTSVEIIEWPVNGYAASQGDGTVLYRPDPGFEGLDAFRYVICDMGEPMPGLCDTAFVSIEVGLGGGEDITCMIPESFSPNGDGLYDQFQIECASYYDDMSLVIYDRYGNQVYESNHGYGNDWEGTSSPDRQPLRDGTYFWVVKFNDGHTKDRAGHVLIWR